MCVCGGGCIIYDQFLNEADLPMSTSNISVHNTSIQNIKHPETDFLMSNNNTELNTLDLTGRFKSCTISFYFKIRQ